jgi:hypothetical protein
MARKTQRKTGSEQIILTQSVIIVAFGLSCYMASKAINDAWFAINDASSMVAIATDSALVTDKAEIDLAFTKSVINNFEYICLTTLSVGLAIGAVTVLRIIKQK